VCDNITEYFEPYTKPDVPYILAVLGEPGAGKTLFARCVIDYLKKNGDLNFDASKIGNMRSKKESPPTVILASALDSES
jgi:ABC-type branched-subunit amino acid transport system ATPase component